MSNDRVPYDSLSDVLASISDYLDEWDEPLEHRCSCMSALQKLAVELQEEGVISNSSDSRLNFRTGHGIFRLWENEEDGIIVVISISPQRFAQIESSRSSYAGGIMKLVKETIHCGSDHFHQCCLTAISRILDGDTISE